MRIRQRVQLFCDDVSLTKQAFKEESDINTIFKKWKKDGTVSHLNRYEGRYEDVSSVMDYHECLQQVMRAEEAFMTLPASVRTRFENDPGKFLDFVSDESNFDEMVELGLARAKPEVVVPDPVVPTPLPEA